MAVKYLLDTNICIYIAKRRPPEVLKCFESLQVGDIAMSLITYGELKFGAEKSQASQQAHAKLEYLSEIIPVLPLPKTAAIYYGQIRSGLEQQGLAIGANDLWIAAHALAEDVILVSNNIKEFQRVPNLKLENWVRS